MRMKKKIAMTAKMKSQAVATNKTEKQHQKYVTIKSSRKCPHEPSSHHHGEDMAQCRLQLTMT
jgi:hypothetical protein